MCHEYLLNWLEVTLFNNPPGIEVHRSLQVPGLVGGDPESLSALRQRRNSTSGDSTFIRFVPETDAERYEERQGNDGTALQLRCKSHGEGNLLRIYFQESISIWRGFITLQSIRLFLHKFNSWCNNSAVKTFEVHSITVGGLVVVAPPVADDGAQQWIDFNRKARSLSFFGESNSTIWNYFEIPREAVGSISRG